MEIEQRAEPKPDLGDVKCRLDRDGFAIVRRVTNNDVCGALIDAVQSAESNTGVRAKSGSTYAVRRLCEAVPSVAKWSSSPTLRSLIETILGPTAHIVRSLLFDKTADANWKVPWHQDLTITVKERKEVAGFGPWSIKAGITHVQPPVTVLEKMLTLRLHLDDCDIENGPLRVCPGSHRMGILGAGIILQVRQSLSEVVCRAARGDVLLMRPLLLHASSSATLVGHRRVIHLEFASDELPGGLQWHVA